MQIDFVLATNELCGGVTHQEVAEALGVKLPTVRQARLGIAAKAHRKAPQGWEPKLAKLAQRQADRLQRLADRLQKQSAK